MPTTLPVEHHMPETFAAEFRPSIRVGFNWFRFFNEKWPIERVVINTKTHLSLCYLPWYIGPRGKEIAYDDDRAIPLRLDDVPVSMPLFHASRRNDIIKKAKEHQRQREVIRFTVPTYALPQGQYFILDGNHRLASLTIEPAPFELIFWNVQGPRDMDCLLDLHFWLQRTQS